MKQFGKSVNRKCKYPIGDMTKGRLISSRKNWQSARSSIRIHAEKIIARSGIKIECAICGYDKYVEVCHIKAVSDFSDSILISEINAVGNLVLLCPNHHWEFDHNLLDKTAVRQERLS